ncbi:AraC family transcriptional regulator [Herbivorax sp. ANBcel31]|uniref:helix-turn-helix transcriptional regulator n=1 Tax=Herbivorax sp. ANBcel31 TaxID=3069754 RepID=UPI0027B74D01|nr:AraC family transcriptional regulator [Herbivorax sp. ANBcel31]MDQ2087180.1 AraC family transcriptional regulator [Herbivorax sp. ANBcel31]
MIQVNYCGYNYYNADFDIIDRPNGGGDYLLLYFLTPMKVELNNQIVKVPAKSFLLYSPDYKQWYQAIKRFGNSFVHFSGADKLVRELSIPLNKVFYIENTAKIQEYFRWIENEFISRTFFHNHQQDAYVKSLLIEVARNLKSFDTCVVKNTRRQEFEKIRYKILGKLEYPWTAEEMASLAHMSTSQFYSIYQEEFHQTPKASLIEARMEYAKYLLSNNSLKINQIAKMIGYENEYHFIRHFKKQFGTTPGQYRKSFS